MTVGKIFGGIDNDFGKHPFQTVGSGFKGATEVILHQGLFKTIKSGTSGALHEIRINPTGKIIEMGKGVRGAGTMLTSAGTGLALLGQPEGIPLTAIGQTLKYGGRTIIRSGKTVKNKSYEKNIPKLKKDVQKAYKYGSSI